MSNFGEILVAYLMLVNGIGLLLMGLDKRRAASRSLRISERNLLLVALAGGAAGSYLGMTCFRHKTRRALFRLALPLLTLVHLGLCLALFIGTSRCR